MEGEGLGNTDVNDRYQVEKRSVMDNLDLVILCLDETVDGG